MQKTIKNPHRRLVGNLSLIRVNDWLVLAEVIAVGWDTQTCAYGDFIVEVDPDDAWAIYRDELKPDAAKFIGQSFADVDEARRALEPFRVRRSSNPEATHANA